MSFKEFGTLVESDSSPSSFKEFGEIIDTSQDNRSFWDKTIQNFGEANLMQIQSGGYAGAPALTPEQGANVAADVGTIAATEALFAPIIAKAGAAKALPGTLKGIARLTEAGTTGVALQTVHSLLEKGELPTKDQMIKAGLSTAAADGILRGTISASQALKNFSKLTKENLPSGLTKPRAVEVKHPGIGTLSKERKAATIEKLDKEAASLIKTSAEKNQPTIKKIEEGFDFEGNFEKEFSKIEKLAEKANPEIDIKPLDNLMSKTGKKYRGIPNLHPEAKKIAVEVKAFGKRAPSSLRNLLKTYRSNNKKIRNIYETSRVTGKQEEYVDFLVDYNKSIADSFKQTLPKDSPWVKMFEDANRNYKNYKDALKTRSQLKEVFDGNPTLQKIEKLADDVKKQKLLQLSMGEKGSKEIIQIAKDLKLARDSIKKMPSKEISKFDAVFPTYFFIPVLGKFIGAASTAGKVIKFARYGYGWFLSTPARRSAYNKAIKAISDQDLNAYRNAVKELTNESNQ